MPLANYCERGDLMDEMQINDPNEEPRVERAIFDASRVVDAFCNRDPGTFAAQTLTKMFDVVGSPQWYPNFQSGALSLYVPPLLAVTSLATDNDSDGTYETAWTSPSDYVLWPLNAEVKRRIDRNTTTGRYRFLEGQGRVQITGTWGITENSQTPLAIRRATLLLAMNYYRRPSSQLNSNGLGGAAIHFGYIDPDVASILWSVSRKYREMVIGA